MDPRQEYEQEVLESKLSEIDQLLSSLSKRKTSVTSTADAIIQKRRIEKIDRIEQSRSSPYIGRMDVVDENGKRIPFYVGKTGIGDGTHEIVVDWRSDFGSMFTSYSGGKKSIPAIGQLVGKRQITINNKMVKRIVDVGQVKDPSNSTQLTIDNESREISNDEYLNEILSQRSTDHQLQEIISSLQEEQDEIVRLSIDQPIIVQGVAGSGKSSVAMHRISYLLYRYEEYLQPEDIIVIAPNKMFISYMQSVIPDLDIEGIEQSTFFDLVVSMLKIKGLSDPYQNMVQRLNHSLQGQVNETAAKFKGSIKFLHMLETYLQFIEFNECPKAKINVNSDFSISEEQLKAMYNGYAHLPLASRREETIESVKIAMKDYYQKQLEVLEIQFDDIVNNWVETMPAGHPGRKNLFVSLEHSLSIKKEKLKSECNKAIKEFVDTWEPKNTIGVYKQLLGNPELLMGLDQSIPAELAHELAGSVQMGVTFDDLAALLYIEQNLRGLDRFYKYMVIDEAQDLSPFQIYMLNQMTSSLTILGDITQSIFPTGIRSWDEVDQQVIGTNPIRRMQMNTSYRSTYEIMELANKVISNSKLNLPRIIPVNRKGGEPHVRQVTGGSDLLVKIQESLNAFAKKGHAKIAIIGKDLKQTEGIYRSLADQGYSGLQLIDHPNHTLTGNLVLIPSSLVKGMEFDAVIIPNANEERFGMNELDAKLLYICVTRAHHDLHIYYHNRISPLLDGVKTDAVIQQDVSMDVL
ncbi:HelD family protein [Marinicrinis lubricantis]|uniref:HelD family protein n=1 Tax=Marinicrinis lubricantis TaxID=2086470 RepID=A0ABW1ISR7_9BACL